jgi:hypothetical protein
LPAFQRDRQQRVDTARPMFFSHYLIFAVVDCLGEVSYKT